jgi:glycosyltransferase involved in cell wall biosynthesis
MSGGVLMVTSCYTPYEVGGTERSVRLLVSALRSMGVPADVLTLQPECGPGSEPGVERHRVPNRYWPFDGAHRPAGARLAWHAIDVANARGRTIVADAVTRLQPAVVHTHALAGFSAAAWLGIPAGVPVVHTLRDYYLLCPQRTRWHDGRGCGTACRLAATMRRTFAGRVDAVVGVSRSVLDDHREAGYFPRASAQVIPNGTDPVRLPGRAATTPAARPPGSPVRLGYLGRLASEKGVDELLVAHRRLPPGAAVLRVAGTGARREERIIRSQAGPGVVFDGEVDPSAWFPAIDALVVPSRWEEPFGRVAVEALASDVPVIAAARGGLAELVHPEVDGLLYGGGRHAGDDAAALEGVLRRVLGDRELLARLRAGARERRVADNHEVARRYAALYAELAGPDRFPESPLVEARSGSNR